uniref:DUF4781 domain-containing protein n=1 Tax=Panagrolaimus superbus TaxID=310955 RepID=A0A914Y2R7_9BILA
MNYIKSLISLSIGWMNVSTLQDTLGGFINAAELPGEWNRADVKKWKLKAFRIQSQYYHFFEGKRFHTFFDADSLKHFVCTALYKNPKDFCNNLFENDSEKYSDDQIFIASRIAKKIISVSPSSELFEVGVVFVCCKLKAFEFIVPVFCVKREERKPKFVDCFADDFESWNHWKENNRLPLMKYCFPANGIYTSVEYHTIVYDKSMEPHLEYGTTPSCDLTKRLQGFSSRELHEECFP